ncbi:uncharacterized protein EV422DRAFT_135221 [Fimicolochytrium jonesii]|uniref:uncharacterized protein n=1 Tax=Fimicolochytrium jonesii TaxID=1396493 RepID=UPI0022FED6F7|nr:uncharacterized protein EV422DRAFT_135221 [Fimicolochytrium jonesii]KAI8825648.1 hypothetical protein EV422DRAFT_135221 [Fimicolochytrium jonesii]
MPVVSTLLATAVAALGLQTAVGIPSVALKSDIVYDLSGAITFGICTLVSLYYPNVRAFGLKRLLENPKLLSTFPSPLNFHPRQLIASGLVFIWAGRLGSHLFIRALKSGGDPRFEQIKKDPIKFSFAFLGQALWVTLTALPVYAINAVPAALQPALGWKDFLGLGIWAFGFAYEVIADRQKTAHSQRVKEKKAEDEPFLRTGLWAKSRFPNYFGEVTLWSGLYVTSLGLLTSANLPSHVYPPWIALAAASGPIFEYLLLTKASGIPPIEKHHDKKHGKNPEYQKYKRETPQFFPKFF